MAKRVFAGTFPLFKLNKKQFLMILVLINSMVNIHKYSPHEQKLFGILYNIWNTESSDQKAWELLN